MKVSRNKGRTPGTADWPATLRQAVAHHRAGHRSTARRLYEKVLAARPNQPDALNLSGVLALERGRVDDAVRLISKAVAADPANADAHSNLGNALRAVGRSAEALSELRARAGIKADLRGGSLQSWCASPRHRRLARRDRLLHRVPGDRPWHGGGVAGVGDRAPRPRRSGGGGSHSARRGPNETRTAGTKNRARRRAGRPGPLRPVVRASRKRDRFGASIARAPSSIRERPGEGRQARRGGARISVCARPRLPRRGMLERPRSGASFLGRSGRSAYVLSAGDRVEVQSGGRPPQPGPLCRAGGNRRAYCSAALHRELERLGRTTLPWRRSPSAKFWTTSIVSTRRSKATIWRTA